MGIENINNLWRVFRAVSTQGRLQLLWHMIEKGELCVNQLAAQSAMTDSNASIQLKILYSEGMVQFRRQNINVIYRAEANDRVAGAEELLFALNKCHDESVSFKTIIRRVTAFTHDRRIEVVRALSDGPLSSVQLIDRCGITSSALSRHLLKLEARKVVRWDGELYCIARPKEQLGKALLGIVCRKETV